MLAHGLTDSLSENKDNIKKMAKALGFAKSQEKEKDLATKYPDQYG